LTLLSPRHGALALALTLPACSRDDVYGGSTFTDNVAEAYAECSSAEIEFLAAKHSLQLAFDECGSNKFAEVDWSPDGRLLYFQLTHGGHVLDAENKTIEAVPTEGPGAGAVWVRDGLLAVPLKPADAAANTDGTEASDAWRIAWYDRTARTLETVPLTVAEPRDLQPAGDGDDLIFTAVGDGGLRSTWRYSRNSGALEPALPFLPAGVDRLVYEPDAGLVGWSDGKDGKLLRLPDGELVADLPGALRVIPHHEGRYVALEVEGDPISLFDQRTWNELSPEAREREQRRKEQWLETLPEWAPREARPPEIHIVDMTTMERYRITAFYGDHFEWWRPRNYWASFVLWGIEGKQLHRNVAITDLHERLRMAAKGELPWGLEKVGPADAGAAPTGDAGVSKDTQPADGVSK
jgi:hypothetical protein